jgi:hypothetical protein
MGRKDMRRDKRPLGVKIREYEANRCNFVLPSSSPTSKGLMDGSVSTPTPVFAAAFPKKPEPQ